MATIYIDNQPYEVADGQNLLHACLSLGFDLPYFCWHPALGSVGACRQCAVKLFKDENDTRGKIVMACMTPATDGTRLSIDDPDAAAFRQSVIAWLMANHPHDCPVCDEGGECHLQDMTVMTGQVYRKFRFRKRTYRNQYLGPFVHHEMNRCIQCYRCVRYYRDYAGGHDLNVFGAHDHVYFGRKEDGVLESEFSGNLVEICPTGVFTDHTLYHHYTRKWDLTTAPSVCVHCGVGCNTIPGERYGILRRIRNRYHHEVNGYFLCDRGRYGYEFVNSDRRIRQPLRRTSRAAGLEPLTGEQAVAYVAGLAGPPGQLIGIGSPRASLEANFALRALVGADHFYLGVPDHEARLLSTAVGLLRSSPARSASLSDVRGADAVLVLGEDLPNFAPMLALAVRQSTRRYGVKVAAALKIPAWDAAGVGTAVQRESIQSGPLFVATPAATRLDEMATATYQAAPDDLARIGFAVAAALDASAPAVDGLPDEARALADQIAAALLAAERPAVIAGTGCGSEAVLHAAANVARALTAQGRAALLSLAVPECNSLGLALLGGRPLGEAFRAVRDGTAQAAIVLENDLFRRADLDDVQAFLDGLGQVVLIDHISHDTAARADVILPAGTFAESDGTLVNNEGRAQRFFQVFVPPGDPRMLQESWRWLRDVLVAAGRANGHGWQTLDELTAAVAGAARVLEPIVDSAPPAGYRLAGLKVARQPHRYSGRTAMVAHLTVHEPAPPADPDSALRFSMEGLQRQQPAPLIPRFWAPRWNSVQSVFKFQSEVGGPLRGGPAGRRLIEPAAPGAGSRAASREIPPRFEPAAGEWLLVPLYHVFGSEEQSRLAPGIAELAPSAYLGLGAEGAAALGVGAGDPVTLEINNRTYTLPVRMVAGLAGGLAGLPVGAPGTEGLTLPARGRLRAAGDDA